VRGARDVDLVLADADRLDDHDVVARGVENVDRFQRAAREAPHRAACGHAAHIDARIACEVAHADPVAEYRSARERARRVDRHDRDAATGRTEGRCELGDERGLAAARHTRDPHDVGPARAPEHFVQRGARFACAGLCARQQPRDRAQVTVERPRNELQRRDIGHYAIPAFARRLFMKTSGPP